MKKNCFNPVNAMLTGRTYTSLDSSNLLIGENLSNGIVSCFGLKRGVPELILTSDATHPNIYLGGKFGEASTNGGHVSSLSFKTNGTPWSVSSPVNKWIRYKLHRPRLCNRYLIQSYQGACPLSWEIRGSYDGITWIILDTVSNSGQWLSSWEEKVFELPVEGQGAYLYYEFFITGATVANVQLRSFRLFVPESEVPRNAYVINASSNDPLILNFREKTQSGFAVHRAVVTEKIIVSDVLNCMEYPLRSVSRLNSNSGTWIVYAIRDKNTGEISFHCDTDQTFGMWGTAVDGIYQNSPYNVPLVASGGVDPANAFTSSIWRIGRSSYGYIDRVDGLPITPNYISLYGKDGYSDTCHYYVEGLLADQTWVTVWNFSLQTSATIYCESFLSPGVYQRLRIFGGSKANNGISITNLAIRPTPFSRWNMEGFSRGTLDATAFYQGGMQMVILGSIQKDNVDALHPVTFCPIAWQEAEGGGVY